MARQLFALMSRNKLFGCAIQFIKEVIHYELLTNPMGSHKATNGDSSHLIRGQREWCILHHCNEFAMGHITLVCDGISRLAYLNECLGTRVREGVSMAAAKKCIGSLLHSVKFIPIHKTVLVRMVGKKLGQAVWRALQPKSRCLDLFSKNTVRIGRKVRDEQLSDHAFPCCPCTQKKSLMDFVTFREVERAPSAGDGQELGPNVPSESNAREEVISDGGIRPWHDTSIQRCRPITPLWISRPRTQGSERRAA